MSKKNLLFLGTWMTTLFLLFGCQEKEAAEEMPAMIDVQVNISPENVKINETIAFDVTVTQGDEKVTDASSVEFEFGKKDGTVLEKIAVEHKQDGVYSLEKSFKEAGDYYIIPHVSARDMHAMPKKEFSEYEELESMDKGLILNQSFFMN